MRRKQLPHSRAAILLSIAEFLQLHGYSPTIRELCESTSLASSSSVVYHLDALQKDGYIRRDSFAARSIRLTDIGRKYAMRHKEVL